MAQISHPMDKLETQVRQVMRAASPWIGYLARAGYAAKGLVYCIVGFLAILAATGHGGDTTGSRGALQKLMGQPFGQALLAIVAVGLGGYAIWCFIQAIEDPEHRGQGARGRLRRIGLFFRGLIYCSLVVAAVGMISGRNPAGGPQRTVAWTAWVMSFPLGITVVGLVGVAVVIYGLSRLRSVWRARLDRQLQLAHLGTMTPAGRKWIVVLSRFGIASRGVVFTIIGSFLVIAAWKADPRQAKDVGQALRYLQGQPYGPWLLGVVAAGLIAYGLCEFLQAAYRRITPD